MINLSHENIYKHFLNCGNKVSICGIESKKVHSIYQKTVQDMPISGKKVYIEITNRKMFCRNVECGRKTFAERYEFVGIKGKKTKRLENHQHIHE